MMLVYFESQHHRFLEAKRRRAAIQAFNRIFMLKARRKRRKLIDAIINAEADAEANPEKSHLYNIKYTCI